MGDNSRSEPPRRGPGRPFPPGTSGNPGGRPRKLRDLAAAIQKAHGTSEVLAVIEKLQELALAGDVAAAKLYLERTLGPVRDDALIEARAVEIVERKIAEARAERAVDMYTHRERESVPPNVSDGGMEPTAP
jgi:Family of unknown function (DUF5681)